MNKIFCKILYYPFLLIFTLSIISCKKNEFNEKEDVNKIILEKTNDVMPEDIIDEINDETTYEEEPIIDIDISDIDDDATKNHLLRMNNVNKTLGKDVYISKEDYFKYRDTSVTLIGDSIADGAKSSIVKYFKNIYIDAVPGREIEKVYEVYNAVVNRKKLGDIVVISLGTNAIDGIRSDMLEKVYEKLDGRPMFLLSIVIPYKGQERNRNRDIKNFIDTHDNCYLIDYHKVMKGHTEYFNEDGVHPNGAGGEVYAQILFKGIINYLKK